MRLQSIKLAGFKSFVDPTTVTLPSNLCAVVGPNGCGKSNIIDAVRWVLGESSAKHLRGEALTDVIFKGSNSRNPAAQAIVELLFDNSAGRVTGEYAAYSEIAVKRKLTSAGNNVYLLNGHPCRRRDILDIFFGTGLGPRSYSIISQGVITQLIESKPEELRVFIEEAAGVVQYKERRRETENRIRHTQDNLSRLTDLRDELGRQLAHLQQQAQAAEQYKAYRAEERLKQAQLAALRWRALDQVAQSQQQAITALESQLADTISEQHAAEARLAQDRVQQTALSDTLRAAQARYYSTGNAIARIEQTLHHQQERHQALNQEWAQAEQDWQAAGEQLAADQQQLAALQAEQHALAPKLAEQRAQAEQVRHRVTAAEQTLQQWQQDWDQWQQRAHVPSKTADVEQARIQQAEPLLNRLRQQEHRLQAEWEALHDPVEQQDVEALSTQLAEWALTRETVAQQLATVTADMAARRQAQQAVVQQLEQQQTAWNTLKGQQASLETLQQAAITQDASTTQWLAQQQLQHCPRLAETLQVEPGWAIAVETVLADCLSALCIDTLDTVAGQLDGLTQGSVVLLSPMALTVSTNPSLPGSMLLRNKVQTSFNTAVLQGVYGADDLAQALACRRQLKPGESIITRDGIWLSSSWLKVRKTTAAQGSVLERQQQLAQLTEQLTAVQHTITDLQQQRDEHRTVLEQQECLREQLQQQLADCHRRYGDLQATVQAEQIRAQQRADQRQRLSQERQACQAQYQAEQEAIGAARLRLQTALAAIADDDAVKTTLLAQRDAGRQQLATLQQQARTVQEQHHHLALRQQALTSQSEALQQAIDRLEQQTAQLQERRAALQTALSAVDAPETDWQAQLDALLDQRVTEETAMQQARVALADSEQRISTTERRGQAAEQTAQRLRKQLEKHKLEWHSSQIRSTALAEQLKEQRFDLATVLANLPEAANESQWTRALSQLHARIEQLGAINLAAIDEYQSQATRKQQLDAQHADLTAALTTLEQAIRTIDKTTRQRFKTTFDQVNDQLQVLFPQVFGGGRAYLALTGDDLLAAGVTIMAQPPGKKNSTIHLLSGGEKALTAIALVFAIFQLNPSPFCLLDEVDAPLDDANVGRYANLVRAMSERVQFVYVTHNKIAMQAAHQLIGITMQEPGVSRPVTVDIEQAVAMAD